MSVLNLANEYKRRDREELIQEATVVSDDWKGFVKDVVGNNKTGDILNLIQDYLSATEGFRYKDKEVEKMKKDLIKALKQIQKDIEKNIVSIEVNALTKRFSGKAK